MAEDKCIEPSTNHIEVCTLSILATTTVLMNSFSLQQLLRENADAIASSIVLEQGKTIAGVYRVLFVCWFHCSARNIDAHGDLLRGLQVVETAVGITSMLMGEKLEGLHLPKFHLGLHR